MEYAVTGGAGFIGTNIAQRLMEQGHSVHVFSKRPPTDPFRKQIWNECDTRTIIDLSKQIPDFSQIDRVIHLAAAMGGVGYFSKEDYYPYINNSKIDFNVLEAIERYKVERSFVASSACAYPTEVQTIEGFAPKLHEGLLETGTPDLMYGREKLMLIRLAERHPLDVRVGILHTVYGIGQESAGQRMKFPTAAATKALQAIKTKRIEVWGNGNQLRSYLYISDAVTKILAVLEGVYDGPVNIGAEGAVTCNQVVELCAKLAGVHDYEIVHNPAQPSGVMSRDCDNRMFNNLYGDLQELGYSEGYGLLIEWLRQNGDY